MIVNTLERDLICNPRLDMNALDTTKILASTSRGVHVYDIRNLSKRLFTQENHLDQTTQCLWSPHRDLVFASASRDRCVYITDMGEVDRHSMNDEMNIQQSLIVPVT
jgi:WD40 repeat protein